MIRARDIKKAYGQTTVLRGVSLEVLPGTIHGFVGPNGAGKSTFLKSLVGVVHPDSGALEIDGVDARRDSLEVRRRVGYAPAETSLYHRMKAVELLDFAIRYHPHSDLERGKALLDELGIPHDRRVGALSHGMKRKVILTQAIACNAPVMVMDEPMEALDPDARRIVEDLLRTECEKGRTIFLSSHDLFSTQRLCSRVTFLHRGRVLRDGPVEELLSGVPGRLHVQLRTPMDADSLPNGDGLSWTGSGVNWQVGFETSLEEVARRISGLPLASIKDDSSNLEDLFERLYEHGSELES